MSTYSRSTTTTITNTNILSLMNTLYKSGFAMQSPTSPNLDSRTMHTLYAFSFVIYSSRCFCDWFHVYCVLRGYVTSFPLETWVVVSLTSSVVAGTMLTALLMMLCVENAFAQRVHVAPYRSGFALICEAFMEWIHAFNNFRVACLIVLLHDLPVTFINFFLLTACRCSGPDTWHWSLTISTFTLLISLSWRLLMLYFAYNNLMIGKNRDRKVSTPVKRWTPWSHIQDLISRNYSTLQKLQEFDESWPIRFSVNKVYYRKDKKYNDQIIYWYERYSDMEGSVSRKLLIQCGNIFGFLYVKMTSTFKKLLKILLCILLTLILYLSYVITFFAPLINHYFCLKNSLSHRHRCSKTFINLATFIYHYINLAFSLLLALTLIVMNFSLLASVHAIGTSTSIPEISQFCLQVNHSEKTIYPILRPASLPWFLWMARDGDGRDRAEVGCKSVYEDNPGKVGFFRELAGPWQARIVTDDGILTIASQLTSNYTNRNYPTHTLLYDYALIEMNEDGVNCKRRFFSKWRFKKTFNDLGWPFFKACNNTVDLIERHLIHGAICK
uniref:Lipase_3 domain-containing protein n=1 Tax=Rhabditophanes sp. KR3021 TaxID=114890 RepID=A0AC35TWA3_9BILA